MKETTTQSPRDPSREAAPFDSQPVDFAQFKSDLSTEALKQLLEFPGPIILPPWFFAIETLSATKTVGHGRTNLTLIVPTIFQTDATTPSASFDMQATPSRHPTVQMHFEPTAYGIASVETYFMQFTIQTFGPATFNLSGFAGSGAVLNGGNKAVNGKVTLTLVLQNVPPAQQTFGFLEQLSGAPWTWFSTQVRFPPLVLTT